VIFKSHLGATDTTEVLQQDQSVEGRITDHQSPQSDVLGSQRHEVKLFQPVI